VFRNYLSADTCIKVTVDKYMSFTRMLKSIHVYLSQYTDVKVNTLIFKSIHGR